MIILFSLSLTLLHLTTAFKIAPAADCQIIIDPAIVTRPLIVQNKLIVYPITRNLIKIPNGQTIDVICSGSSITGYNVDKISTTCTGGQFKINGQTVNIGTLNCKARHTHIGKYTRKDCEPIGKEAEIGFATKNNEFIRQIQLCVDTNSGLAFYSHYTLTKSINSQATGKFDATFLPDHDFYNDFVGTTIDKLYTKETQRVTINTQIGLDPNNETYIKSDDTNFFSRGHFSARADFYYRIQQMATYHYINAAPQWQNINGKSWAAVESQVKEYSRSRNRDLEVYTGPWGITTLPHADTNEPTYLYLYTKNGEQKLPVPDMFWKLVYEPLSKKGVVIFMSNNPHKYETEEQFACSHICSDVFKELIGWLTIPQNKDTGFIYACELSAAQEVIPFLPKLDASGGLLI